MRVLRQEEGGDCGTSKRVTLADCTELFSAADSRCGAGVLDECVYLSRRQPHRGWRIKDLHVLSF